MPLDTFVTLGRSGLRVSPYTLGAMTFGEDHGWGASVEESEAMLTEYLERGGNSIDTANIYTNGHSEKIIGDYLAARPGLRDRIVLGSKFFGNLFPGDPNGGGAGRKAVVAQAEESLRRLGTDYLDLYWLHNWDRGVPVEETLRALDDLVTAGKIRYVGLSDLPAWKAAEAQVVVHFRGWTPAIAMQIEYSLLERTGEGELIPMAAEHGLGVLPWSPLKSGWLSGKFTRGTSSGAVDTARGALVGAPGERDWQVIDALHEVAADAGVTPAAAALAWVGARPGVSSVLIGARRLDQLKANLDAVDVRLSAEQAARLDEVSTPTLNFPADNNRLLAPSLAFAGATVDGRATLVSPRLGSSTVRY
ncbi:aldo/keto reductase [Micromonospora krabiensis]|uniref:Predicted oxidoreductase n=1 Tax=Micromonospora krabiensis TaxID=307121 RepID=A0A1C3NAE0_9ACTN|nr:aldo/keto reductase [Micromonospora krabiensis]SBV29528.1 Predicted oxidoreductase [Micromonospora krabiensis]